MKLALQSINDLKREGLIQRDVIGGATGATFYLGPTPMNLNPEVQKPRIAQIPQMGNPFVTVGSSGLSHILGERTLPPNIFLIRVIREICGSNCSFQDEPISSHETAA